MAAAVLAPLAVTVDLASAGDRPADTLQRAFAEAAAEYQVPESVLLGVSYLESRWDGHQGAPSVAGGYGPMHLTDVTQALAEAGDHHLGAEDPRGDTARPRRTATPATPDSAEAPPARLRTLHRAARLTGLSPVSLREDPAANVRGGAALLADIQRRLGRPLSDDPADWYGAVAGYSGAEDAAAAARFADEVFRVMRAGEARTTDSGQRVVLPATPRARTTDAAEAAQLRGLGLRTDDSGEQAECPRTVACRWVPAPYEEYQNEEGETDYGNHDKADRPRSQSIDYIVIHDTEASWDTTQELVQDPTYVSWHYSLRSADGYVTQHVRTRDVAWHAGNWYVNAKSIGLEHEGFLTAPDAWYTEAMYRSSARLVRYLARKYDVPLDRQHILGHDNVPGVTAANIPGMHTDPGPYWDWQHYFTLLGAPFTPTAGPDAEVVTIRPDYRAHRPEYTGCEAGDQPCEEHGSGAVRLHTAPSADAPLVRDVGLRPDGGESTIDVNDTGARASTGQQYVVAERRGDWTAVWYLGDKAWFHNPADRPTAVPSRARTVTPKAGRDEVPVYGRAYPEAAAYPEDVPVQELAPLPYTLKAGQAYVVGLETRGEYYYSTTFDPAGHRVVRGEERYYQIQLGHRVAYVRASDVELAR